VVVKIQIAMLVVVVGLMAGCKKAPADAAKPAAAAPQSAATPVPPPAPTVKPVPAQLPDVIARVNGAAVDRGEFERAVRNVEAQAGGPVPPDRRDAIYRQLLDQIVALKLLAQESAARKVAVPDAELDARIAQVKSQFPNEQAFTAALAERQMTPDKLRSEFKQQMLAMKLLETDIGPSISVTEADITGFYQKNPDRFKEPEAIHVAHILFRIPDKADAATKAKVKTEAEGVLAKVKKGADFAGLAKQYSQDQGSAANGGDLGFVPRGQTVPAFEQAAFALKPGQLSDLVESPFGFHIIKALAFRAGRSVPLAEVRPQVENFLKEQQKQEKTAAYIDKLKAKAKIDILI
jgi:peptidyl-prolyl cis-trans isomerase C